MSRLLADFYSAVGSVSKVSTIHEDPKRIVVYLVDALRPSTFPSCRKVVEERRVSVSSLAAPSNGRIMKYETHIPAAPSATSHFNPYQMERILDELVASRSSAFWKVRNALRLQLKQLQPRTLRGPTERLGLEIPDHHSLNISDHHDHFSSVVKDFAEGKTLYETRTGKKGRPESSAGVAD
ncbi:hypothetical protein CCR75_001404 [Bremia lactucae]|uniref:Uncharacterized protein n=1 Tax=Bremia lactucae TaxID=4779 RepID=A0A976FLQ2_BRELC|nr:hypothetical protein CCR75_001404 [Bremia lactucae]